MWFIIFKELTFEAIHAYTHMLEWQGEVKKNLNRYLHNQKAQGVFEAGYFDFIARNQR